MPLGNIYLQLPVSTADLSECVLATVTSASGSTPGKPGISALFRRSGLLAGTVGGGILEARVQEMALEAQNKQMPLYGIFTLDSSSTGGEDALCGGNAEILVDPDLVRNKSVYDAIKRSLEEKKAGILVTTIRSGNSGKLEVERYWFVPGADNSMPAEILESIGPLADEMMSGPGFRRIKIRSESESLSAEVFAESVIPRPKLIIAGAGHIGKALSLFGSLLDFEVTVIDDRSDFASKDNLPYADSVINADIGSTLEKTGIDGETYIVIVTRGHRDDGNALRACIGSEAAYVGMIGSRTKIATMKHDFIGNGIATEEQWGRIYAPVGIDINSQTVQEIAVSIAAQLIMIRNSRGKNASSTAGIHR